MGYIQVHQSVNITRVEGSVYKRAGAPAEPQVWLRDNNHSLAICVSPDEARKLAKKLADAALDAETELLVISEATDEAIA